MRFLGYCLYTVSAALIFGAPLYGQETISISRPAPQSFSEALPESGKISAVDVRDETSATELVAESPIEDAESARSLKDFIKRNYSPALDSVFLKKSANKRKLILPPETDKTDKPENIGSEKFHWKPALIQSGIFLAFQHTTRLYEEKTRRELGGAFFHDWKESVRNLRGWDDGGKIFTNYIAHPLQGSITGRIFVNNSELAQEQQFGKSKSYWKTRFKAMAWSAVWSTQFEIGLISEATIGNVGKYDYKGRSKMAWGDLVVTPTIGTGFLIAEDAIEKYFLNKWIDKKVRNKYLVRVIRTFVTPTTSFSNLLRAKPLWYRDTRN